MFTEIYNLFRHSSKEQVYETLVLDYNAFWNKARYLELSSERIACYSVAEQLIGDASRVLDIGCGKGDFIFFLKKRKKIQELGVDISGYAIKEAAERGLNVVQIDITKGDLTQFGDFNYVVLLDFLEHIPNSEEVLIKIKNAFPKATLIISIPNAGHYYHRFRLFFGGRFMFQLYHPAWHLRFWTIKDFVNLANNVGLKIDKIIPYYSSSYHFLRKIWPNIFAEYVLFAMHPWQT